MIIKNYVNNDRVLCNARTMSLNTIDLALIFVFIFAMHLLFLTWYQSMCFENPSLVLLLQGIFGGCCIIGTLKMYVFS